MRILITGGAGFIGSHLCERLLKEKNEIICMDNLITGNMKNILHFTNNKNFKFIKQDVTEFIDIKENLDYVLHLASPASPVDYLRYPIQTLKVGALGTHKTLGITKSKNATFILASTSEIYGDPLVHPQSEKYWGNVNPIGPRGVYDEAKRFAEAMTFAYHRYHKIKVKIVRIFNTYGERMRINDGRVIPTFIYQILKKENITIFGKGEQTRSFCYISDLIEGIYKLLHSEVIGPINIGSDKEITILELACLLQRLTNSKSKIVFKPIPEDDPKLRRPDITLAKEKLGWQPKVELEEGLKNTIAWFKSQVL